MEEKTKNFNGLVLMDSSELQLIRGGIGWREMKEILKILADLANIAADYWPDFVRGFKKGWNLG